MLILFSFVLGVISLVLMVLNFLLSINPNSMWEKYSVFECGFDPKSFSRLPFSMHFFLVALIFLIFDVEISLLVPIPFMWGILINNISSWLFLSVVSLLLLGALMEWMEGSLEWQS